MARGRKPGFVMSPECYVYAIVDGPTVLYVGKGAKRRAKISAKAHGGDAVILAKGLSDDEAFEKERALIAELMPLNNKAAGGNGGRVHPKEPIKMTAAERRYEQEMMAPYREMDRIGTRVYAARMLLRLDLAKALPASELERVRPLLAEVAYGQGV